MLTIIITFHNAFTHAITIKREVAKSLNSALDAFNIYVHEPDCIACAIIENTTGFYIARYDEQLFE